jgi:DNA processing protein
MTRTAERDLSYWLWMHRVSPSLHQQVIGLLSQGGDLDAVLAWSETKQINALLKPDYSLIQPVLDWLAQSDDHHVIPYTHAAYPALLKQIPDPPLVLYLKGHPELLSRRQMAIVGARKATPMGCDTAFRWAKALTEAGITVTSGMALGIDAEAHRGALAAKGPTLAVVGTSPDIDYPKQHRALAQAIVDQGGAVLSEFWPTTPALPSNFPRRNRIISGLAQGVLVVEAALRSGSLITARMALEQNREVFAIPGSIANPMARGTNHLIKQGAKLVDCLEDILEEFQADLFGQNFFEETGQDPVLCSHLPKEDVNILSALEEHPIGVEAIVTQTGYSAQQVSSRLMELQFQGLIKAMPGGYIRVRRAQNERECA